jgi:methionyl aminopeptidase
MSWERNIIIKSPEEIALEAVRQLIRPGVTTAELDAAALEVIRKHGATPTFKGYPGPYPYPASICVSINEQLVHGIPGKRKLQAGEIVSIDCGSTFEGFVGDSAFTIGVGEISPLAQRLIEVTEQALYVGISKMRADNRVGDVSAAIQEFVEGTGFNVTREYTGHGVGRQMHEGPQVPNYGIAGRGQILRQGMTIALEPMVLVGTSQTRVLPDQWTVVSVDGSLTAHWEHSVAITEGEALVLTLP